MPTAHPAAAPAAPWPPLSPPGPSDHSLRLLRNYRAEHYWAILPLTCYTDHHFGQRHNGRILTIPWDKTGSKYGKGKGLRVFADGEEIAKAATLSRVTGQLPRKQDNKATQLEET